MCSSTPENHAYFFSIPGRYCGGGFSYGRVCAGRVHVTSSLSNISSRPLAGFDDWGQLAHPYLQSRFSGYENTLRRVGDRVHDHPRITYLTPL